MLNVEGRHPAVAEFRDMFNWDHLPEGLPREVMQEYFSLASMLLQLLPDGPQLTRALHRLWESKNEAVFMAVKRS